MTTNENVLKNAQSFSYGLFDPKATLLVAIDLQERLLPVMNNEKRTVDNANLLISGVNTLQIPILITEQYPKGLGKTDKRIQFEPTENLSTNLCDANKENTLPKAKVMEKLSFSIFSDADIVKEIASLNIKTLLVCGIESHVCVLQSVLHALKLGLEVWVANDALSSRSEANHNNALALMASCGAKVTNTESVLFGAMTDAKHPKFKTISSLVK